MEILLKKLSKNKLQILEETAVSFYQRFFYIHQVSFQKFFERTGLF